MNNVFKIIAVVTGSCNSRNQAANSTPVRFKPLFNLTGIYVESPQNPTVKWHFIYIFASCKSMPDEN